MPFAVPGHVAEVLRRSTVQIISGRGRMEGRGSGVVLAPEQVITNAHVLHGQPTVESWEGTRLSASVEKIDRQRDIALLSVPGLKSEPAGLADSHHLRVGTPVVAVGNPLGFTGALSSGIVHHFGPAHSSDPYSWIHADIRLAPGNSGGPLADFHGRVVGINTMIVAGGLAMAIPSRAVQAFLSRKKSGFSLGVVVRPVQTANAEFGLMILELVKGGSAECASLLPGDIFISVNGIRIRTTDDLQHAIGEAPDALLAIDFYRAGTHALRRVNVRLTPERIPSAA